MSLVSKICNRASEKCLSSSQEPLNTDTSKESLGEKGVSPDFIYGSHQGRVSFWQDAKNLQDKNELDMEQPPGNMACSSLKHSISFQGTKTIIDFILIGLSAMSQFKC